MLPSAIHIPPQTDRFVLLCFSIFKTAGFAGRNMDFHKSTDIKKNISKTVLYIFIYFTSLRLYTNIDGPWG